MRYLNVVMRTCVALYLATSLAYGQADSAPGAWLDKTLTSWNQAGAALPQAPARVPAEKASIPQSCLKFARKPSSAADRQVIKAGWTLFSPAQKHSNVAVVTAMSDVDGMCRPMGYQSFVFVNGKFAGTLSPVPMSSRTDGALGNVRFNAPGQMTAEFVRYTDSDPLCCPSRTGTITYRIDSAGSNSLITPVNIAMNKDANPAAGNSTAQQSTVTGTVTYRMRIALAPTAVVKVQLLDVSRADAPATVIAEQIIETKGKQVPIPFSLTYDPAQIKENMRYQVRAQIMIDGNLAFTSTQAYSVITQGNPKQVEILVQPPARTGGSSTDQARPEQAKLELENTRWKLIEVNGQPVTTAPDEREAHIRLNPADKTLQAVGGCNGLGGNYEITGKQIRFKQIIGTMMACPALPTEQAMIKALEAANSFKIQGDKLELYAGAKLLARFAWLPASGQPGEANRPGQANAELENTRWKLVEVSGQAVTTAPSQREAFIRLDPTKKALQAMGGCNGLGGNYEVEGEQIRFKQIIGTMMACSELPTEQAMIKALEATNKFKIVGDKLELYADEKLLARFAALYLK